MKISLLYDLETGMFLPYLPSELGYEVEIWCVHLVEALDVLFWGLDFSTPFHPIIAPKKWFLSVFLIFLIFLIF